VKTPYGKLILRLSISKHLKIGLRILAPMSRDVVNLVGKTKADIRAVLEGIVDADFRADQIYRWIYQDAVFSFGDMTNLSKSLRARLHREYELIAPKIVETSSSEDGSEKMLFKLEDDTCIETVVMRERDHYTFCLSSQAGCALECTFCATGQFGFVRNLSAAEIIGTFLMMRKTTGKEMPINVVFMGMGEPLLNFEALAESLSLLTDTDGIALPQRRITVSSAGISGGFSRLRKIFPRVKLALSVNSTDENLRDELMPINRKYPLSDLVRELKDLKYDRHNLLTLEYVLIEGVNDSPEEAARLGKLGKTLKAKISIIPFNPVESLQFSSPDNSSIDNFVARIAAGKTPVTVRRSKGSKTSAACGQLSLTHSR